MDLCLAAERRMGSMVSNWWWDQEGLELEGMRMAAQEEDWEEVEDDTERKETKTEN